MTQMSSIEDENVIQTFFLDRADPAFGKGVCIGCPERSMDDMHAFNLEKSIKGLAERAVIVMDQEP
jgi:hypothetical protein